MPAEVKVCGLRRPADVAVAVRAGATYLGMVYAGGPRRVTDVEAREVVAAADGVPVLAVWGAPDGEAILRARDLAGFAGVQLHGGSDATLATSLRAEGLLVWRVARLTSMDDLGHLDHLSDGADAVLIEPRVPGVEGGAGVALDLPLALAAMERLRTSDLGSLAPARDMLRTSRPPIRTVLAGGLRPDTVRDTITQVRPDIVDVSSGVERSPGVKDPFRVRRFIQEAFVDHPSP